MSVTAAQGFEASGVSAGIRPSGRPDVAVVRSVPAAVGAALWTTNRVQAAPVTVSKRHLALAAAAGRADQRRRRECRDGGAGRGRRRRICGRSRRGARARAGAGSRPLDRRHRRRGCRSTRCSPGARAAAGELSAEGGDAAAAAILTTDSGPKVAVARAGGFTVGGMAKGAGMIHPRLATMLVVLTTDYPLAEGEAEEFLRPAVAAQLQPHLGRRRLLDERRRDPARERGERCRSRRRGLRSGARRGMRRSRAPGRGGRRGCDRRARDRRQRRRLDGGGRGDRAPDRDLPARQDGGVRSRSQLGPGADGGRLGARTGTDSRSSTRSG